jgi:cytochrome c biogenesis protein CcmG, thiol:disulfide interchange protein DsbE
MGLDGKPHRLKDYRGKQVILNFWASWCAPCRVETPLLQAAYQRLANRGVVVIGVNMREDPTTARRFVDEYGVTYPILLDRDADVAIAYEAFGLPTTFFIDPDGVIQAKEIGVVTQESLSKNLSLIATPNPQ